MAGGRSRGFLALYALANAGGVVAFLPLLTLLLPLKVEAMAPAARIGILTAATLAGAVAASLSNVAAGAASDRTHAARGTRRPWIVGGLIATLASYGGIAAASSAVGLVLAVVVYQAALNVLLAPLFAVMADEVPDAQKGLAGGLLAAATPVASFAGGVVTALPWLDEAGRLTAVCALIVGLLAPLLLAGRIGGAPRPSPADGPPRRAARRTDLAYAWAARLCVQVAGNVLFTYLFFYFESIAGPRERMALASSVGHLTGLAFLAGAPVAVVAGRASDRWRARRPVLFGAAALTAAGLATMAGAAGAAGAGAGGWTVAVAGYVLFAIGSATFLGLHSAYTMQILPDPRHRGRDLGIVNLTNTLPALVGPGLTWALAPDGRFAPLLVLLAVLTLAGGALILPIGRRD